MSNVLAFYDFETTGLGKNAEIISIGLVTQHGTIETQWFIMPTVPVDEGASAIHGLTIDVLQKHHALPLSSIMPKFINSLVEFSAANSNSKISLVAHNGKSFDSRLLRGALKGCNMELPPCVETFYDSLFWARSMFPGKKNGIDDLIMRFKIPKSRGAHDALEDCIILRAIWHCMMATGHPIPSNAIENIDTWMNRTESVVPMKTLNIKTSIFSFASGSPFDHFSFLHYD
jgi:DNA polymerase III epsilon subunit-like protein